MGQRQQHSDIVYGDDCITCFAHGETPKYVYVRFADVEKCPDAWCAGSPSPPNGHVFCLEQVPAFPCFFYYHSAAWELWYRARHTVWYPCGLWMMHLDPPRYYFQSTTPIGIDCEVFFVNQETCIVDHCGVNGHAIVTNKLESIELLSALNIETAEDLFMELFPLDDGSRVYKYCRLQDGTNIKIKLEP